MILEEQPQDRLNWLFWTQLQALLWKLLTNLEEHAHLCLWVEQLDDVAVSS